MTSVNSCEDEFWCTAGYISSLGCWDASECWNSTGTANCTGPLAAICGTFPTDPDFCVDVAALNIVSTQIGGSIPPCIGSMAPTLTKIELSSRALTGTLPASLSSLSILKKVDMINAGVTGTLPSAIGSLGQLIHFDMEGSSLSGTLPDSFGSLSNLEYLSLSAEGISGALPSSFGSLFSVEYIDFTYASVTDVPDSWCESPMLKSPDLICHFPTDPDVASVLNQNLCTHVTATGNYSCAQVMYAQNCLASIPSCLNDRLSAGAIVGIAVAFLAVTAAVAVALYFKFCRRVFPRKFSESLITTAGGVAWSKGGESDQASHFQNFISRLQAGKDLWLAPNSLEIVNHGSPASPAATMQERVIGAGSSGRIVLAKLRLNNFDFKLSHAQDVFVALKQHYNFMGASAEANFEAEASSDFQSEVSILRRLRHPNVVSFIGLYSANSDPSARKSVRDVFIVMEYAENGTVTDHLARPFEEISLQQRSRWMIQTAGAMDYLHQNSIVHRDLKPSNILLNRHMECLITDFGISSLTTKSTPSQIQAQRAAGTVEFMPPEAFDEGQLVNANKEDAASSGAPGKEGEASSENGAPANSSESTDVEQARREALMRRMRESKRKREQEEREKQQQGGSAVAASKDARDSTPQPRAALLDDRNDEELLLKDRASPRKDFSDGNSETAQATAFKWDVFSFAVFVACIFNRSMPYQDVKDVQQIPALVLAGKRPVVPSMLAPPVQKLLQAMWHRSPKIRPGFGSIVSFFVDEAASNVTASASLGQTEEYV